MIYLKSYIVEPNILKCMIVGGLKQPPAIKTIGLKLEDILKKEENDIFSRYS